MRGLHKALAAALAAALAVSGSAAAGRRASEPQGNDSGRPDPSLRRADAYYHLMKAELAARRGRYLEVLRQLREATSLEPESAALHAEAAALLLKLGQRAEANRMAKRALELDPGQRRALRVLADLAAARATASPDDAASLREAMRLYEQLASDPDVDGEVLLILSQLKFRARDAAGAIPFARRLCAKRPGDAAAARLLAQAFMLAGQRESALESVLEFLAKNPGEEDLLLMAEELARQTEGWEELEAAARTIAESEPDRAEARRVLGEALLYLDRAGEAVEELERALDLAPGNPSTRYLVAMAYGTVGRLADSTEVARSLLREYPDAVETRRVLGEALDRQGDVEGALEAFTAALDRLESAPAVDPAQRDRLRLRIARLLADKDRANEALQVLDKREDRDGIEGITLEATVAVRAGERQRARVLARRLRSRDAAAAAAMIEGEVALSEGNAARSLARFREAIALTPGSSTQVASQLLADHGYAREAEALLREWVESEPDNDFAGLALGGFLERRGRFDEAEAELRRTLELNPRNAMAMNYLGYSLADRDERLDEALQLIRGALELDPHNGAYLDSLGWVYYRLGRYGEARGPLEKASREFPRDPTVLDHLGDLYLRLGEPDAAAREWRRALEYGPSDPEAIREKLKRGDVDATTSAAPGQVAADEAADPARRARSN